MTPFSVSSTSERGDYGTNSRFVRGLTFVLANGSRTGLGPLFSDFNDDFQVHDRLVRILRSIKDTDVNYSHVD